MDRGPVELIGVHKADGGILGELRSVLGKVRGTAHCALCEITHGTVRRKPDWDAASDAFPIPIRLVHLNERNVHETEACVDGTPAVLTRWSDGSLGPLLRPDELEMDGSVEVFFDRLRSALERA